MRHTMCNQARNEPRAVAGVLAVLVAALLGPAGSVSAEVTVFQQGVSPTAEYAGCTDTYIERSTYTRPRHKADFLWTAGSRKGLIRFDLSSIAKDRKVHRALLRLYLIQVPNPKVEVLLYALARPWDETAMWASYKAAGRKPSPEHKWSTPGGDIDKTTDFGAGKPGLAERAGARGGPFGHIVEFDVTRLVSDWVSGKRPNYGCLIDKPSYSAIKAASSDNPNKKYRPELVIEHYGVNEAPEGDVELKLPPAPGPRARLSPLAGTKNAKESSGPWRTVRLGRNSNCQYRKGHAAGYAKQDVRYPGNWGWTPRIRVGGTGGDINHAVFYFDLSAIPKGTAIKKATLKAFAEVGNQRIPDQKLALGQVRAEDPKRRARRIRNALGSAKALAAYSFGVFAIAGAGVGPGWKEDEFTFARAAAGRRWTPQGQTLLEATDPAPVAVAHVGKQWASELTKKDAMPETWLCWDATGTVRAWTQGKLPNRGLVLDGRLMGGEMVIYSDEWIDADRRPYLEVELAGEPASYPDGPFKPEPLVPAGDYWVEPMRRVHARWKGTKGTFSQYGDSITVTMAFWTPLRYTDGKGMPPEMLEALGTVKKYIHKDVWHGWKGGKWGCSGSTTISWAFDNIDVWQKRMNAEAAAVMWGTNDAYLGPAVPIYTEKYAAVINRILADGTVPIITTLPPRHTQRLSVGGFMTVWNFRLATLYIARAKKTPLIDLWAEMVRRRPEDWDGKLAKFDEGGWKGYNVPTMMARDGIHPSNPKKFQGDFSAEGLRSSGFNLRNYLTLKTWYEIYQKVLTK